MLSLLRSHTPIATPILDLLFPLQCIYCQCYLNINRKLQIPQSNNPFEKQKLLREYLENRLFCPRCLEKIESFKIYSNCNLCLHCGSPLRIEENCACQSKLASLNIHARIRSIFAYSEEIRKLIFLLKFRPSIDLCNWVSLVLFSNLSPLFQAQKGPSYASWDSITFVPSKLDDILKRGGYSTYWVSKSLAKLLGDIPILEVHSKSSHRQTSLKLDKRLHRANRFSYKPILKHRDQKSTLLIDDMLTTGSSSYQVARELYNSGIKRVDILTLARATDFKKNYLKLLEGCQFNISCDT